MAQPGAFYAQPPPIFTKPVENGANLIELSRMGNVAAAGSTPLGPGRFVPGAPPPVQQAAARIPSPAAAAAQQQYQQQQQQYQQPAPQPTPQVLAPSRPAGAPLLGPVPPIPPQAQVRAPAVPPTNPAECGRGRNFESYDGPIATTSNTRIDDFKRNVKGDVKTRLFTVSKSFVPMITEEKELVIDLKNESSRDLLRYKHKGEKRVGDLTGVVILEVRLLHLQTNIKTPVTFNFTGCKGRDYDMGTNCRGLVNASAAGGDYHEHNPQGRVVSRYFPNIDRASLLRYGKLRNSDLRKDITDLPNKGWSLVPINSPILEVIDASQDGLKIKLNNVHVIDDVVPVETELVGAVIDFLNEHVDKFPGHDCTEFALTATRSSGDSFSQAGDLCGHSSEVIKYNLKEPAGFCIKVELDYCILSNTEACSEDISSANNVGKNLVASSIAGKH